MSSRKLYERFLGFAFPSMSSPMLRFTVSGAVHNTPAREPWEIWLFCFFCIHLLDEHANFCPFFLLFREERGFARTLIENYFLYPRCVRLMDEDRKSRIRQLRHFSLFTSGFSACLLARERGVCTMYVWNVGILGAMKDVFSSYYMFVLISVTGWVWSDVWMLCI